MEGPPPFRVPSIPGTPLYPVSPDRLNQQRIPQSPSLPNHLNENSHRRMSNSSDVQTKVAFLNSLSGTLGGHTSPTKQSRQSITNVNAAVERARLGREEAETRLIAMAHRLREQDEELERVSEALDDSRVRERAVCERVESLMEEVAYVKQHETTEVAKYVRLAKSVKKELYQVESARLEALQEAQELKRQCKVMKSEIEHEREEKEKARQEAFERAYTLAGVMEEVGILKEKLKTVEQDRDTAAMQLRTSVAPEERRVRSMEAGSQTESSGPTITVEAQTLTEDRMWTPTNFMDVIEKELDGRETTVEDQVQLLQQELDVIKRQRRRDEDMISFLHVQCQYQACPCRTIEQIGKRTLHESDLPSGIKRRKVEQPMPEAVMPPEPVNAAIPAELLGEQAVEVPLPSPQPQELELRDDSLEPTALLEEITQVIVEPNTSSKQFTFSLSTSSRPDVPSLQRAATELIADDLDLFDMSPPKACPPRPSTSLGVMNFQSPIRLVPESPQTILSTTPDDTPRVRDHTTQITRVALNDASPIRSQRRSQSRPNIRAHSRGRSPATVTTADFQNSVSASPASITVFPVTPIIKHSRARSQHPQTVHAHPQAQFTSSTTTIPLHGEDDVFSPENHAHTVPLNLDRESEPTLPGTPITREAALAQIRARRDRARSVNMRRENKDQQRDIGENVKRAPGSAKRGLLLREAMGAHERGRDISQASAPGRMFG